MPFTIWGLSECFILTKYIECFKDKQKILGNAAFHTVSKLFLGLPRQSRLRGRADQLFRSRHQSEILETDSAQVAQENRTQDGGSRML